MLATDSAAMRPTVSVIVPARNEEVCLGACLQSLTEQRGVALEILVVDDHSTDRTRQIAQSFPGIRVIEAGPMPTGWTGKNSAVTSGAHEARGEWLLFTDADTVHRAGSLARAVSEAKTSQADMLSYSPEQIVESLVEKAVMPVIFSELAVTYSMSRVGDPKSSVAAANGQYILIKREAYDAVGGHAAVAGSLLEDVALAKLVKTSGRKIVFRFGGDQVRTRMYRSFNQLREGWTKNLSLLFPSPRRLAVLRSMEFVLIALGLALALRSTVRAAWPPAAAGIVLSLTLYSVFLRRIRRAHFARDAEVLALFGLPIFSYLLWRSQICHRRGMVQWKGREYRGGALQSAELSRKGNKVGEERDLSHA